MKSVDLYRNSDGTWTARIFEQTFRGTREQCVAWLRMNGEEAQGSIASDGYVEGEDDDCMPPERGEP